MTAAADDEFLTESAVTRSMLGWGVLAGPIYLTVGLARRSHATGSSWDPISSA